MIGVNQKRKIIVIHDNENSHYDSEASFNVDNDDIHNDGDVGSSTYGRKPDELWSQVKTNPDNNK